MPTCDQTTIALTIRSTGTAPMRRPREPVLARPIPVAASSSASTQIGTAVTRPARVIPVTASTSAA